MSFFFETRPSDAPFVESIWRTESEQEIAFLSQANTQWQMVLARYQGKTTFTVRGPETKVTEAASPPGVEFVGITFKHGTFMPHLPLKTIMDRADLVLPDAANQSFWLNSSIWQLPTYDNADTFISQLIQEGVLAHDPIVDAALHGQGVDLSLRSLQYRFLRATGLTQSTLRQIERAKRAAALLQQGRSILDTTYELGYFDQAHLTRSLKRFMGQTPSQIAAIKQPG